MMKSRRLIVVFLLLSVHMCIAHEDIVKSSLTFVIDDTGSMYNEIDQVKKDVNAIFDTVAYSKSSQIENFVLVTFNDPDTKLRTITKDRDDFRRALASITVNGGGDCPEMALAGVEQALTNSLPNSYLYVFTDASAKDFDTYDRIKSISQKKQSQVVFVLTGECSGRSSTDYQVYYKVAKETSGQVFEVGKSDITDVLKYVKEIIKERGEELVSTDLRPGYGHRVSYTVDSPGDVLISATGDKPIIGTVTGPDGSRPKTEHIITLDKVAAVKVPDAKPGEHVVTIGSKSETHAVITEKTSITFLFGFSAFKPSSIEDTAIKPPPDGNSFLSIKLVGEGVTLTTATILDKSNNVIMTLPLEIVDEKEKFYVTPSFYPPSSGTTFRVSVSGYDDKTKTPLKRTSLTPLTRQDITTVAKENRAPKVSIEGYPTLLTDYDAPLQLKCKVHGYPKPDIIWKEMDTGLILSAKVSTIDVPYDYISILDINKAIKNTTYQCEATNWLGKNNAEIQVFTERKIYFNVIEVSKDVGIEYDKEGSIVCKVDAFPPAKITWYKDGDVLTTDASFEISSDESTLTIKHIRPGLDGAYLCEAKNDLKTELMHPNAIVTGMEKPNIDKTVTDISIRLGSDAELSCRLDKGVPPPKINWLFFNKDSKILKLMKESGETIHLPHVSLDQLGTYKCIAENILGSDELTMELHVLYPPKISPDSKNLKVKDGEDITIRCDVDGYPVPEVIWFVNSTRLESTKKTYIAEDHSLKLKATVVDTGNYTCKAKNDVGTANKTVLVEVHEKPNIDKKHSTDINVKLGLDAELSCRLDKGVPPPKINWYFMNKDTKRLELMKESGETIHLPHVSLDQSGTYKCIAENILGSDDLTLELHVLYPPKISPDSKNLKVKDGEDVTIRCDVDGYPAPEVKWFVNTTKLESTKKTYIAEDHSLRLKATVADTGNYTCMAKNDVGTANKTVVVEVHQKPNIDKKHSTDISVKLGSDAELSCRLDKGVPPPKVNWYFMNKDTKRLELMKESGETIHLPHVSLDHSGTYKCIAENILGSDDLTMELHVLYPPKIRRDSKNLKVEDGEDVTILCDVEGYPVPEVKWFVNSTRLESTKKTYIAEDHSLTLKATVADTGNYTCKAKNEIGTANKTVLVEVYEKPNIDKKHSTDINVRLGSDAELSCRLDKGVPPPKVNWYFMNKDRKTLELMKESGETIHLPHVSLDQSGTYKCIAENILGSDDLTMELHVLYPPKISPDSKNLRVKDGEDVTIRCDVDGSPAPEVKWFVNSTRLDSTKKTYIAEDHSLRLKATVADTGNYTCKAKNDVGTDNKTVLVEVYEKPNIDKTHSTDINVRLGSNAELSCRVDYGVPPPKINWFFMNKDKKKLEVVMESGETIHLPHVSLDQSGTYKCIAKNILGSDELTMELHVLYPPKIKRDAKNLKVKDGEDVTIRCDVDGYPAPEVKWFVNSTRLESTKKTYIAEDHSLRLEATVADTGNYTCKAKNDIGTANKTVLVEVYEKPNIDKTHSTDINVRLGSDAELLCRLAKGVPPPKVNWYFMNKDRKRLELMKESGETIHLPHVSLDQSGTYKCIAENLLGSDDLTMELHVLYPPKIKRDAKNLKVKDGEDVTIRCDVEGYPAPEVKWFVNSTKLESTKKTFIAKDHSLRLTATVADTGNYTCEAKNEMGTVNKTVFVQVYVPVNIETPKSTNIETLVGSHLILPCRADGYPKPDVTWTFQSIDPKTPPKPITAVKNSVPLRSVQLDQQGQYTCVASNIISGTASLTYEVNVFAPPVIENMYPVKSFEVVEGDLVLRIKCKATGSPKPTITWKKDGLNIAYGSEWYDMEEDGTLIIKNIDDKSQGTYVCYAENKIGHDTEIYDVVVNKYPEGRPTSTVFLVEGETKDLECAIPHKLTDSLRWFKDGKIIKIGELTLLNVAKGDDGLYSCRVSNFEKSRSMHVKVDIGFKPTFMTKEDENIDFNLDNLAWLVCEANGDPTPKVSWKHNGESVADMSEMIYPVQMKYNTTGTYECEVYNVYGRIHRKFKITPRDCILNTKTSFPNKQPLMVSKSLTWPKFEIIDGQMIIPKDDYFYLNCPSGFASFPFGEKVTAYCQGDTNVKISGNIYDFTELKCKEEVKPDVENTGIPCLSGNTEKIIIGYKMYTEFLKVYEICMDKDNKVALFTKHELSPDQSDTLRETEWLNNDILPFNFDTIYDCKRQVNEITSMLRRSWRAHPSCCFARRQLVNARDLRPGIPATASSTYLNVVPHWSTCNSKNWEDVETRVRNLVKAAHRDLLVYTGTAQKLRMSDLSGTSVDISLSDDRGRSQPVAEYFWKIIQDESALSSLVIVQVNIPDLSPAEALKHVYCYDICGMIEWMNSKNWKNVEDGFTYCCTITEFESAFGYEGKFVNGNNRVLFDA